MPPESSSRPRPAVPTGSPPGAARAPAYTNTVSAATSTPMVSAGRCTSTRSPVASTTRAPTTAEISGERIAKRLSERRLSTLKLGGGTGASSAARAQATAAAPMASMSWGTRVATDSDTRPNTRSSRAQASATTPASAWATMRPCGVSMPMPGRSRTARATFSASVRSKRRRLPLLRKSSP